MSAPAAAPSLVVLDAMDAVDQCTEDFVKARNNHVVGVELLPFLDRLYGASQRLISLTQAHP